MSLFGCAIIGLLLVLCLAFPKEGFDMADESDNQVFKPTVFTDRMLAMWRQQEDFMRLLQEKRGFPAFPTDISSKPGQKFLNDIRHHIMDELFEAGQHLKNSKSHRATEIPEVDREAYKEELVDALHLYLELVIASGITLDELVHAYLAKGVVNTKRIEGGY
jgi:dUTPase-like protein